MITLDAKNFMSMFHTLLNIEMMLRGHKGKIDAATLSKGATGVQEIVDALRNLDLPVSVKTAENMLATATTAEALHKAVEQLANNFMMELDGRRFYGVVAKYEPYFEQAKLFGPEVFDAFPSANDDIYEAGTSLALERGTACVMHLMRVLESGLAALAQTVSVGSQNDWGKYLSEIGKELERRQKAAGARSADEQFYAEVALHLGNVRVAWRNPTMHVDKSYSVERAEEILIAVRQFMRHLAQRVKEKPLP